jgi:hypothetical protein
MVHTHHRASKNVAGLTQDTIESLLWRKPIRVQKFTRETSAQAFQQHLFFDKQQLAQGQTTGEVKR